MRSADWITERLPAVDHLELANEIEFYGAGRLIARPLGLRHTPRSAPPGTQYWQHGWTFADPVHPLQIIGEARPHEVVMVATQEYVDFLAERGYGNVHAVGLPFIYADHVRAKRRPESLLVMPAHSLVTSSHRWNEDDYAAEIGALEPHFSSIVVCISRACVEKGYWTGAFERQGIPWISGAAPEDQNALLRMTTLFKSFEYVTTNAAGSHIPYAAYSGCRVSVYGSFAELEVEDFKDEEWYTRHPDVLELNVAAARRSALQARYPMLFCEPAEAPVLTAWGAEMVGARYRRIPREIAGLLGWNVPLERLRSRLGRVLPQRFRRRFPRLLGSG